MVLTGAVKAFGRAGRGVRAVDGKDGPVEELAAAIRRVLSERDALNASVDGATVADIAAKLHLSESTVRNYLSAAIGKTGTRNRMEAVRAARQQGWL